MNPRPLPRLAIWLVERFLPKADRDAIVGDLIEECALPARASTRPMTALWCWGQVARSIPLLLWSHHRHRDWLGTLGVAIAAYVVTSVIEALGVAVLSRLLRPDAGFALVLAAIVGLGSMMLGGYAAASIRQGAAPALATIILLVVLVLFVTMPNSVPLWYGLTFLIAGPVAAVAGGWLNLIRRAHRPA
jgi:hypothetical protein